jgi:hypothetical protein
MVCAKVFSFVRVLDCMSKMFKNETIQFRSTPKKNVAGFNVYYHRIKQGPTKMVLYIEFRKDRTLFFFSWAYDMLFTHKHVNDRARFV